MKNLTFLAVPMIALSSLAFAGEVVKGARDCDTLTVDGSFFKGKTYKSTTFVPGVATDVAVKRAAQSLVGGGWKIASADEKLGVVSADTSVSYGSGKTAPLGVTFVDKEGGLNVNIVYSMSGGVSAKAADIGKQFCSIVDAIEAK
jgi:hypothetical protein